MEYVWNGLTHAAAKAQKLCQFGVGFDLIGVQFKGFAIGCLGIGQSMQAVVIPSRCQQDGSQAKASVCGGDLLQIADGLVGVTLFGGTFGSDDGRVRVVGGDDKGHRGGCFSGFKVAGRSEVASLLEPSCRS
jgi:hypothetical protein